MDQIADPQEEVRKLQELVKRLEFQNQELLNKQDKLKDAAERINGSEGVGKPTVCKVAEEASSKPTQMPSQLSGRQELLRKNSLDDTGLIDIDDLELEDEDSWLYASPKGVSLENETINSYKWLRKDVEDPHNKELQLARRALAYKLDELAILNPSDTSLNHYGSPDLGRPPSGRLIDSRTFTRGKKKSGRYDDSGVVPIIESSGGEIDEGSPPAPSSFMYGPPRVPHATDVIDVQEIARMQEESLRQSSPCSTPKRSAIGCLASSRWSNSSKNSISDGESPDNNLILENGSHPRHGNGVLPFHHYHDAHSNSTHSSPPGSFHGSNNSLDNPNDSFHNSLPNLSKGANGIVPPRGRVPHSATNGTRGAAPLPPRSLALSHRMSSMSPVRTERRSIGMPARSVSNIRSSSPSKRPTTSTTPCGSPSYPNAASPGASNRAISSPSRPRLQPSSVGSSPTKSVVKSGLPIPRMSKIQPPKPRSGIPVPSQSRQPSSISPSDNELWSDGCY